MTYTQEKVFRTLCKFSFNWHGCYVFTSSNIAQSTSMSKYSVLKMLHELRGFGLVKNDCMGRPAIVSGYEYPELECEAMPPLRGFSLTSKGRESDIYKQEENEYNRSFVEWATGCDESEVIENEQN